MVRLAKFNDDTFVQAAIEVAATCGVGAVSMAAIASKAGAPMGSVYHRFGSRSEVLARAWLQAQAGLRQAVAAHWQAGRTWPAVQALLAWCRQHPLHARFLMQCEGHPPIDEALAEPWRQRLDDEQLAMEQAFEQAVRRCAPWCASTDTTITLLRFVLLDAPLAMLRPALSQGREIPANAEDLLRTSHEALCPWWQQAAVNDHDVQERLLADPAMRPVTSSAVPARASSTH
jgi:AcrR family transcriptional regulator